jgi:malate dehydrogenase (oxaloacetate-decarboxylating)
MGLGIIGSGARRVTDEMFVAAASALKETSPALDDPKASLLMPLEKIRSVSRGIAIAVAHQAQQDGVAASMSHEQLEATLDKAMWIPEYPEIKPA